MKGFEFVIKFITRVILPCYLVGSMSWGITRYFAHQKEQLDFEIHRTILQGQLKAMCIEKHACGDDCKEI